MKIVTNNIFLVMLFVVSIVESIAEPARNIIKLSHPLNKPNSTSYSRFIDALNASHRRLSSIQVKTIMAANGTEARLIPLDTGYGFVASVGIGTPPTVQLLHMDTGSSLTWTQCKGCKPCKTQKGPIYDPTNSLINLLCGDPRCDSVPGNACAEDNNFCNYEIKYADGGKSLGNVGLETFTFKTSKASGIVIGCGLHNELTNDNETSGMLGLGTSEESTSTRLGKKFSYCIGSLNNTNPEYHFLIIGDGAIMAGDPSPLILENERYYVSLEGIMVGNVSLDIDPSVFKLGIFKQGGVIIDSGTAFTYLTKPAYEKLRDEIVRLLPDLPIIAPPYNTTMLCFHGWFKDTYVPSVILKFAKDQTISIEMESLFMQMNLDTFCMLVAESPFHDGTSIIGILAQQYYNIGYDVPGESIYFYRTDCERTSLIV